MRPALLAMRHADVRVLVDRRRRRVVQFASSGIAWISRFASTSTRRARLPVSKTTVSCCAAVPRRRSGARCHAKLALARGAMGVARSIATLELFILKKECCCFFVCASGLVVVVVARREGISPPTENHKQEPRRI